MSSLHYSVHTGAPQRLPFRSTSLNRVGYGDPALRQLGPGYALADSTLAPPAAEPLLAAADGGKADNATLGMLCEGETRASTVHTMRRAQPSTARHTAGSLTTCKACLRLQIC